MSNLFNNFSFLYDGFMRFFKLDKNNEIITIIKHNNTNLNILDIGGGTGVLADELIKLGNNVTIIDKSINMTKIALKRNNKINIINKDILEIDDKVKYDVIVIKDCLHHIKENKELLDIVSNITNSNGFVLIQDFNPASLTSKLIFTFERLCFEKVYPITSLSIIEMLKDNNFKMEVSNINKRDYIVRGEKYENN